MESAISIHPLPKLSLSQALLQQMPDWHWQAHLFNHPPWMHNKHFHSFLHCLAKKQLESWIPQQWVSLTSLSHSLPQLDHLIFFNPPLPWLSLDLDSIVHFFSFPFPFWLLLVFQPSWKRIWNEECRWDVKRKRRSQFFLLLSPVDTLKHSHNMSKCSYWSLKWRQWVQ
jgi:hypothetical protein